MRDGRNEQNERPVHIQPIFSRRVMPRPRPEDVHAKEARAVALRRLAPRFGALVLAAGLAFVFAVMLL